MRFHFCLPVFLMAAASPGFAQSSAPDAWLQVQAARLMPSQAPCLGASSALGLAGGQWLSPAWGWQASALRGTVKGQPEAWSAGEWHLDGTALFNPLGDGTRFRPYLLGGLGVSRVEGPASLEPGSTTRFNLVAGAGFQVDFLAHGIASFEARALTVNVRSGIQRSEYQGLLGLGYRWGGSRPGALPPSPRPYVVPVPPARVEPRPEPPSPREPLPVPVPVPVPVPPPKLTAPPPDPVIISAEVDPEPRTLPARIVLDETVLHFVDGGAELTAEGRRAVERVAALLKRYHGDYSLTVVGHTSSTGSAGFNRALSERRARAVAKVLIQCGIPAGRIRTRGKGFSEPVASNRTARGQSRNRRVEILIQTRDPQVRKRKLGTGLAEAKPARHRSGRKRRPVSGS